MVYCRCQRISPSLVVLRICKRTKYSKSISRTNGNVFPTRVTLEVHISKILWKGRGTQSMCMPNCLRRFPRIVTEIQCLSLIYMSRDESYRNEHHHQLVLYCLIVSLSSRIWVFPSTHGTQTVWEASCLTYNTESLGIHSASSRMGWSDSW
jgi:hypothetical protein